MWPVAMLLFALLAGGLIAILGIQAAKARKIQKHTAGQLAEMSRLTDFHRSPLQDTACSLLTSIAKSSTDVFDAHAATVHAWNISSGRFSLQTHYRFPLDLVDMVAQWSSYPGVGALGHVVESMQPQAMLLEGMEEEPFPAVMRAGLRSVWMAPIVRSGELLGLLCVWHQPAILPSQQDYAFLHLLACQGGAAFERESLVDANSRLARSLALLHVVADLCMQGLSLNELLKRVAKEIELTTGADLVSIMLVSDDMSQLELPILSGRLASSTTLALEKQAGIPNWVLSHGEPVLCDDVARDSRHAEAMTGIVSELCVPLQLHGKVTGLISLKSEAVGAFSREDQQLLLTLAAQLAATLENQALVQRERERAQQLYTVTEIAQDVVAILNVDLLLDRAVNLVRNRFGFYDVNVLLVDDAQEYLVWHAGTRISPQTPMVSLRNSLSQGITGWVVRNGQPLMVDDVSKDPRYVPVSQLIETRSELAVPVALGNQVLGVLDVQSDRVHAYTDNDVFVLQTLANLLAIALGNARSFEKAQQRVAELMALRQVSLLLISETDVSKVLDTIAASALQLVGANDVQIHLYDAKSDVFTFGTALGEAGAKGRLSDAVKENALLRAVIQKTEPIIIDDVSKHPVFWDQDFGEGIPASVAGFPLMRGESIRGILTVVFSVSHVFSEDELRVLELLADQAALSIERAQLFEELNRRVSELRTMTQVGQVVATTLDLNSIYERIMEQVLASIPAEAGAIFLQDDELLIKSRIGETNQDLILTRAPADSAAAAVLSSSAPMLIADVQASQRFDHHATIIPNVEAHSLLCAPMLAQGRIMGGLELVNKRGAPFDQDDLDLLSAIATAATAAIENARLYEERGRRLAESTLLFDMAQQTTSSLAFEQVLDAIVQQLRTVISCRAISLFLLDESSDELLISASSGLKPEFRDRARIKIGEGVSGLVFKEVKLINIRDVKKEQPALGLDPTVNSLMVVPLVAKSRVIGTLSVDSTQRNAFTTAQERLLTIVAAQAASSIENAQLFAAERQRAEELRQAYEELQQLDRLKSQFVQNISHELRTPLTFIKGYADLLADEAMGSLAPEQKRGVDIIARKTEAVIHLVNDIITLQEIESVPIKKEMTSLGDIVSMVVDTARATANAVGLSLQVRVPDEKMWVLADEDRLIQVFDNILGNAIKFSPDSGTIQVSISDDNGHWQVAIADHGIGIPEAKLEKVFERFYQIDGSTTRRFGGTGLGLAIAREIVSNHQGRIWAESVLGEGSTFYVSLPKYLDGQGVG